MFKTLVSTYRRSGIALIGALAVVVFVAIVPGRALARSSRTVGAGLDCAAVLPAIADQFPAYSDSLGWSDPAQYSTIQFGNIDGNPRSEMMIARGPDGIITSRFDAATGMWIPLNTNGPFGKGWDKPQYYSTIQLGDIDGSGRAEDLIGRGPDGIETYSWDPKTNRWVNISGPGGHQDIMTDAQGYANPSGYTTIHLANMEGTGDFLVGRRPGLQGGLEAYDWEGSATPAHWELDEWTDQFSDAAGFGEEKRYGTLQVTDLDYPIGTVVLYRSSDGVEGIVLPHAPLAGGWPGEIFADGAFGDSVWDGAQYYSTIHVGNIGLPVTANGFSSPSAVIGRGPDGIVVYGIKPDSLHGTGAYRLVALHDGPRLSDAAGWNKPEYYSTIQLADVDGRSQDELLARGKDGLHIWKYDPASDSWSQPYGDPAIPQMSDEAGWNLPESYLTIRVAEVDGSGHPDIIGRGPQGMVTFKLHGDRFEPALNSAFPGFTSGDQPAAYKYIGEHYFGNRGVDDIRAQYTNENYSSDWENAASKLEMDKTHAPAGINASDWNYVAGELEREFSYVHDTYFWFAKLREVMDHDFAANSTALTTVRDLINLQEEDHSREVFVAMLQMFEKIGHTALNVVFPESKAAELTTLAVGLMVEGTDLSISLGSEPNIDTDVASLETSLLAWFKDAGDGSACLQQAFLQNWPLLNSLGEPIDSNRLSWQATDTQRLEDAIEKGYEISVWQALSPVKWKISEAPVHQTVSFACQAPRPGDDESYEASGWVYWITTSPCGGFPNEHARARLFDDPGLDVPIMEAACGLDGWRIPRAYPADPPCPDSAGLAATEGLNQSEARNLQAREQIAALTANLGAQATSAQRPRNDLPDVGGMAQTLAQARLLLTNAAALPGTDGYTGMADDALRALALQVQAATGHTIGPQRAAQILARVQAIRALLTAGPSTPLPSQ
jgi:hypothetical protein